MKRTSTLTNWKIEDRGDWYSLIGSVINDERFDNGEVVRTSMIEKIDFVRGIAETKNTIYRLQ